MEGELEQGKNSEKLGMTFLGRDGRVYTFFQGNWRLNLREEEKKQMDKRGTLLEHRMPGNEKPSEVSAHKMVSL